GSPLAGFFRGGGGPKGGAKRGTGAAAKEGGGGGGDPPPPLFGGHDPDRHLPPSPMVGPEHTGPRGNPRDLLTRGPPQCPHRAGGCLGCPVATGGGTEGGGRERDQDDETRRGRAARWEWSAAAVARRHAERARWLGWRPCQCGACRLTRRAR